MPIKEKTIFVLGAGASIPYSYPSGLELLDLFASAGDIGDPFSKEDFYISKEFKNILKSAYPSSIDFFLMQYRANENYVKYGKAFIIACFINREASGREELFLPRNINDLKRENEKWYGYFFNNIIGGKNFNDLFDNDITIINFNYDRSFECFAYHHIVNTYRATDKDVYRFLKHINYCHVYGCIAPIYMVGNNLFYDFNNDFKNEDNLKFAFNSQNTGWWYGNINDGIRRSYYNDLDNLKIIKVIGEERDNKVCPLSKEILTDTKHLCFLGFGYDETNMDRLNLKSLNKECFVTGTVRDISIFKLQSIIQYFDKGSQSQYYKALINNREMDLVKNYDIITYLKSHFFPLVDLSTRIKLLQ